MTLSTPVRVSRLNLSSLLTDLTPNTQTWSRLKAALSVHRKGVGNTHTNTPVLSSLLSLSFKLFLISTLAPLFLCSAAHAKELCLSFHPQEGRAGGHQSGSFRVAVPFVAPQRPTVAAGE